MNHMYASAIFATVALVLLANLPTGHAFRCYLCSTENDRYCGDPFNNTSQVRHENCESPYTGGIRYVCRKVKYHKHNNEIAVSRSCDAEGDGDLNPCSPNQLSQYLRVEHCSTCTSDLCNSAPAMFSATSLIGPAVVFFSKLKFL